MATTIAVLGGTGPEGGGLALRWAHAGHTVIIGSRDPARAQAAAEAINAKIGAERARGAENPVREAPRTRLRPPRPRSSH